MAGKKTELSFEQSLSRLDEIVKHLERDGVSMARKGTEWTPTALSQMMHNERYMGDIRMQKYFVSGITVGAVKE